MGGAKEMNRWLIRKSEDGDVRGRTGFDSKSEDGEVRERANGTAGGKPPGRDFESEGGNRESLGCDPSGFPGFVGSPFGPWLHSSVRGVSRGPGWGCGYHG